MLSAFLFVLGCLQAGASALDLRGASLTGARKAAGLLVGVVLACAGIGLALAGASSPTFAALAISIPLSGLALLVGGIVSNARHDPSRELFAPAPSADWNAAHVAIPCAPRAPLGQVKPRHVQHFFTGQTETNVTVPGFARGATPPMSDLFADSVASHFNPAREIEPEPQPAPSTTAKSCVPATWLQPKRWTGAAVLLICGAGDNRFAFKWRMIRAMLARGMGVLTIDPPGHGEHMTQPTTVEATQAAAVAALDWLCARPGVGQVAAVGISFGGCQAAWLAANDARVAALALVGTPAILPTVTRKTIAREAVGLGLPRNLALLREGSLLTIAREWSRIKGAWYGESLYAMIEAFDTEGSVRACGQRPTLFLHGARDAAVPPSNAVRLHQAAFPRKELVIASQATHLSIVLFEREIGELADWLARELDAPRQNLMEYV